MITKTQIMDAAAEQLQTLFPEMTLYRNRTPTNFARPSALISLTGETMACRTSQTVSRGITLVLDLFVEVDDYHFSQIDTLNAMADVVMEHFSAPALPVSDRALDIGQIKCEVNYDYAEISIPLSWDDTRKLETEQRELIESLKLNINISKQQE